MHPSEYHKKGVCLDLCPLPPLPSPSLEKFCGRSCYRSLLKSVISGEDSLVENGTRTYNSTKKSRTSYGASRPHLRHARNHDADEDGTCANRGTTGRVVVASRGVASFVALSLPEMSFLE